MSIIFDLIRICLKLWFVTIPLIACAFLGPEIFSRNNTLKDKAMAALILACILSVVGLICYLAYIRPHFH